MARVLTVVFVIYVCIHIFRLEMYPLYMFAMFSKQEQPKEEYHAYKIYVDNKTLDFSNLDYRKYTVLMNTINQYEDIISNDMVHPESGAIDKFIGRLNLENTGVKNQLKGKYTFNQMELIYKLGLWMHEYLNLTSYSIKIEKEFFSWRLKSPKLMHKMSIYEMVE